MTKNAAKSLIVHVIQFAVTIAAVADSGSERPGIIMRGDDTLRAFVEDVKDYRVSRWPLESGCSIELRFEGGPIRDATLLLRARLTTAIDDTGGRLLHTNRIEVTKVQEAMQQRMTLRLKRPPRQATSIRVKGEVDLYTPTNANGGIIMIDNVIERLGQSQLQHPLLTQHGIELHHLDPTTFSNIVHEAKKEQTPTAANLATIIGKTLSDVFFSPRFSTNTLGIHVLDPQHVVAWMELRKGDGRKFERVSYNNWEAYYMIHVGERVPLDAQLRIHLALPGNTISVPFLIEHIALP